MDYLIYICLIIVIGAFFFLQNHAKGKNSMIIVFILSILGLLMLFNDPPEVITGTNTSITFDGVGNPIGNTAVFITEEFTVVGLGTINFFALIFIAFLLLSVTNIYFRPDDEINDMNVRE